MEKRLMTLLAGTFLFAGSVMAQTNVSGTVTSSDDGEPVVGAAVKVEGTNTGTVTDVNGHFQLNAPAGAKLVVSYLGMKSQTVKAGGNMKVVLVNDNKTLDEVMVVAYGTQKKSSFTGSAASIDSKALDVHNVTNVTKALDGQVAGVTVTSGSGQPGSGSSIVIRGFGSINASSNPLYVVDGAPYDGAISAISPSDIASITVLKDASAGALYGARGANGVVMITTKKGEAGKTKVTLRNTMGWSWRALPTYQTVNQKDFVQLTYEALRNSYEFTNGMSHADAAAAARAQLGATLGGEQYNPFKNYTFSNLIDPSTELVRSDAQSAWNENWYDMIYHKGAPRHEHELSISGGSERTQFLVSMGYLSEEGTLKNTNFQRYSGRANVDSKVNDWFKAGMNTSLAYTKSKYNQYVSETTANNNPFYTAQFVSPLYPMYLKDANGNNALDANGNAQYDYGENGRPSLTDMNILGSLYDNRSNSTTDNVGVRTYLTFGSDNDNFGWAKGLKFTINFDADYRSYEGTEMMNKYHGDQKNAGGMIEKKHNRIMSYTFNQLLTWNRSFGKHNFDILAGHEFYQYTYKYLVAGKTNIVDGIDELAPAAKLLEGNSYSQEYDIESWLGRANYNYDDKYYFSASFRRDGSSRFYKDNRWGTFWSVGANWRINKEEFMKDLTWIDNLSFKISYGQQGNDDILDADGYSDYYLWQNLYSLAYSNGDKIGGLVATLENKDITWEKNGNLNIGLEGTLFDQRLNFSVEYYNRKTTDMLLNYPMALSTGFSGYNANVGDMRNTGWEFMVGYSPIKNKDVQWHVQWMGSTVSNKVLKLTDKSNQIVDGNRIIKEGMPINTFYLAKSAGVDPLTGAQLYYAYKKMNDDGSVEGEYITSDYSKASTSKYYMGDRIPDLYGSISSTLNLFQCIDLSVMTTYSIGGKILDYLYAGSMNNMYYNQTWNTNELRRWQKPGDITDVPRVEVGASSLTTDQYLINASYFAIKNITAGYTFPRNWTNKLGLSSVRFYSSIENLALWSHLKGMDPQYNFSGSTSYTYSPNKTFTIGLDINF
jgi:TonB-linked SusC/RagA family outer membrane protein